MNHLITNTRFFVKLNEHRKNSKRILKILKLSNKIVERKYFLRIESIMNS